MMNILFMMNSMIFWCMIIVMVFSVVFSVSVLMLFMKICVGQVLNQRKLRLVLISVVQNMISLLVFGMLGISRYLVNFMLFDRQQKMFSVLVIIIVGMIVRLLRLLVRFIVLFELMMMKQVRIMKKMFNWILMFFSIGMIRVVLIGVLVVIQRNMVVLMLNIDCQKYFQWFGRLWEFFLIILWQLFIQLMVLNSRVMISIIYMQWLERFVYSSVLMVMVVRIRVLFMVGVFFFDRCDCGLLLCMVWLIWWICKVWIIQGFSYSDSDSVVSMLRMLCRVRYWKMLKFLQNCCRYLVSSRSISDFFWRNCIVL